MRGRSKTPRYTNEAKPMKITVFEGNKGDCLLVQSTDKHHVLIDGGLVKTHFGKVDSYSDNISGYLGGMRDNGIDLDLVCVSHIDQDHIGGILKMLQDEFDWRVFEYQTAQGLAPPPPENPRPPAIKEIWHNAFHETIGQNGRSIYSAIAAAAPKAIVNGQDVPRHGDFFLKDLATSMNEAVRLSRFIGAAQLNIPLNDYFDRKLVRFVRNKPPLNLGSIVMNVVGPTGAQLKRLRDKWNEWLDSEKGVRQIRAIKRDAEEAESQLGNRDFNGFLESSFLGPAVGNRSTVTDENIASIVLLIEDADKRLLTTGDALDDDIITGLKSGRHLDNNGCIHIDALKIQHHGSENNYSVGFGKRVTADHYIFCGNGKHHNPDKDVLDRVIESRVGPADSRNPNIPKDKPFTLWFTSNGETKDADREHMQDLMNKVKKWQDRTDDVITAHFFDQPYFEIEL